jgi:hypothetical protein
MAVVDPDSRRAEHDLHDAQTYLIRQDAAQDQPPGHHRDTAAGQRSTVCTKRPIPGLSTGREQEQMQG